MTAHSACPVDFKTDDCMIRVRILVRGSCGNMGTLWDILKLSAKVTGCPYCAADECVGVARYFMSTASQLC